MVFQFDYVLFVKTKLNCNIPNKKKGKVNKLIPNKIPALI